MSYYINIQPDLTVCCQYCGYKEVFTSKDDEKPPKSQATSKGWLRHHDGSYTCIECVEQYKKEQRKSYFKENKEKIYEYRRNNRSKMNAINRRWHSKNPKKQSEYNKNRRMKMKS